MDRLEPKLLARSFRQGSGQKILTWVGSGKIFGYSGWVGSAFSRSGNFLIKKLIFSIFILSGLKPNWVGIKNTQVCPFFNADLKYAQVGLQPISDVVKSACHWAIWIRKIITVNAKIWNLKFIWSQKFLLGRSDLVIGLGQNFLTRVGYVQIFDARVGSAIFGLGWGLENFPSKSQIFQKISSGRGQKVPKSKPGRPLIYWSSKVCMVGLGQAPLFITDQKNPWVESSWFKNLVWLKNAGRWTISKKKANFVMYGF